MDSTCNKGNEANMQSTQQVGTPVTMEQLTALLNNMRAGINADMQQMRTELRTDMHHLRTELRTDMHHLRTEMQDGFNKIDTRLATVENTVKHHESELEYIQSEIKLGRALKKTFVNDGWTLSGLFVTAVNATCAAAAWATYAQSADKKDN